MKIIRVEASPRFSELFAIPSLAIKPDKRFNNQNFCYLGSGKAAIALILSYLRSTGELNNKMSEVLVPSWIGNPVYQQVNWFGFPVLQAGPNTSAMMIYHQYGYPQNMERMTKFSEDRGLVMIEDCAHAPRSFYNGKICGSFGRFSLYSFSKFSFCYALGGVGSKEQNFLEYVYKNLKNSSGLSRVFINTLKIIDEANFSLPKPIALNQIEVVRKAAYAIYGDAPKPSNRAISMWQKKRDAELVRRELLYKVFRAETDSFGICNHLEPEGVTPYAIPIRIKEGRMIELLEKLAAISVKATINHFDFNRCHFDSDFRKTVLVPCHGDISNEKFEQIIGCVKSTIKGIV
jgi:hypothetical protein